MPAQRPRPGRTTHNEHRRPAARPAAARAVRPRQGQRQGLEGAQDCDRPLAPARGRQDQVLAGPHGAHKARAGRQKARPGARRRGCAGKSPPTRGDAGAQESGRGKGTARAGQGYDGRPQSCPPQEAHGPLQKGPRLARNAPCSTLRPAPCFLLPCIHTLCIYTLSQHALACRIDRSVARSRKPLSARPTSRLPSFSSPEFWTPSLPSRANRQSLARTPNGASELGSVRRVHATRRRTRPRMLES